MQLKGGIRRQMQVPRVKKTGSAGKSSQAASGKQKTQQIKNTSATSQGAKGAQTKAAQLGGSKKAANSKQIKANKAKQQARTKAVGKAESGNRSATKVDFSRNAASTHNVSRVGKVDNTHGIKNGPAQIQASQNSSQNKDLSIEGAKKTEDLDFGGGGVQKINAKSIDNTNLDHKANSIPTTLPPGALRILAQAVRQRAVVTPPPPPPTPPEEDPSSSTWGEARFGAPPELKKKDEDDDSEDSSPPPTPKELGTLGLLNAIFSSKNKI